MPGIALGTKYLEGSDGNLANKQGLGTDQSTKTPLNIRDKFFSHVNPD